MALRATRERLTPEQRALIRQHLMVKPVLTPTQRYRRHPQKTTVFPFLRTDALFVDLPFTFARKALNLVRTRDLPVRPSVPLEFKGKLYPAQEEIAREAEEHLRDYGTTTLNLHTACGKTVISLFLAARLGKRILVYYHSTIMRKQWHDSVRDLYGEDPWVIGEEERRDAKVILAMFSRLQKIPEDTVETIGTFIIDEAHTICTEKRAKNILRIRPRYIIAATATLSRQDGMIGVVGLLCGKHVVYRESPKTLEVTCWQTGIVVPSMKRDDGTSDWAGYTSYLCNDVTRNALIVLLIQRNAQHKILVLTWRLQHAHLLARMLAFVGLPSTVIAGKVRTYDDARILIGTYSKIGTGFDEKNACRDFSGERVDLLIHAGSMRCVEALEQADGRVCRADNPRIIHLVDKTGIAASHWRVARRHYQGKDALIKTASLS